PPDPGTDIALENASDVQIADPTGAADKPGFWSQMGKTLKTPKGALTAASLAMPLYGLMKGAQLPGAAKTALGASGPAVAQAQATISAGGMAGPLWNQQKAGIDAQINQQLQDFSRQIQQNAANSGQGGANSDVVQQQIASMRTRLEAQRQQMYMAAAQQNVTNAVAELTGGNQTLMALANLQFQEDRQAQEMALQTGEVVGKLASLWPSGG
ncbi:MAG: hypothetical protein HRJ53_00040, partial [Acidobacteria bacterium Pan2503]|nr:hypothetical protein [Candidatus Acidoferrum panamensis]